MTFMTLLPIYNKIIHTQLRSIFDNMIHQIVSLPEQRCWLRTTADYFFFGKVCVYILVTGPDIELNIAHNVRKAYPRSNVQFSHLAPFLTSETESQADIIPNLTMAKGSRDEYLTDFISFAYRSSGLRICSKAGVRQDIFVHHMQPDTLADAALKLRQYQTS